jgi:Flp pilus assembly protein CpaB
MNPTTMRRLATGIGVVSLVAALIFTVMLVRYRSQSNPANTEKTRVVVVRSGVSPGEPLTSARLLAVERPKKEVDEANTLHSVEEADGKVALSALLPDTPITKQQVGTLADWSVQAGLMSGTLPPGYVAMTVAADRLSVLNGALKIGDHVDVMVSGDRSGSRFSRLLLQNINVLAVGALNNVNTAAAPKPGQPPPPGQPPAQPQQPTDAPEKTTVTLQLTRQQANSLNLALAAQSQIRLVLRSKQDVAVASVPTVIDNPTKAPAAGTPAPGPAKPKPPRGPARPIRIGDGFGMRPGYIPPASPMRANEFPPPHGLPIAGAGPANREHTVTIIRGDVKTTASFPITQ